MRGLSGETARLAVSGLKNVPRRTSDVRTSRLMQFMVTISVCPETLTKHVNEFRGQNGRPSLYSEQLSFAVTLYFLPPLPLL
jgi:hypothetical protein